MKRTGLIRAVLLAACWLPLFGHARTVEEKLYVAVEGEGVVAVFDTADNALLRKIPLAHEHGGAASTPAAHNIQVAPDGKSVWVTVNNGAHGEAHGEAKGGEDEHAQHHAPKQAPADEVVVIDPLTDTIVQRIEVGSGLHLAHVVVSRDGSTAYVTAQNEGTVYRIDGRRYQVIDKIAAPAGSQPHGLRLATDGARAYVALLQGRALGILDVAAKQLRALPLPGAAVQTAVTPDGHWVAVSLYDDKSVALYDSRAGALVARIPLYSSAKGPVQSYPSPDGRFLYVADQGHYFAQPDSRWVYKIDLQQRKTVAAIQAGVAPHGIVVSLDGRRAYVTNLVGNDISVLDLSTEKEVARLAAGKEPNGISLWHRQAGGTP